LLRVKERWQEAYSKLSWRIKLTLTCKHSTPGAHATAQAKKGPKEWGPDSRRGWMKCSKALIENNLRGKPAARAEPSKMGRKAPKTQLF